MKYLQTTVTVEMDLKEIKAALKKRGIRVNKGNKDRFIKLIRQGRFVMNEDFFERVESDREILLMHGFTFET